MNRSITNVIRFIIDECLPPIIRDSRWFMYPFFYIWYKGKNVKFYMDFKDIVFDLTPDQFSEAYRTLDCLATDRPTDMNQASINYMIKNYDKQATTLLDVGCGRGYWLDTVTDKTPLEVTGCDMYDNVKLKKGKYVKGNIEKLPFADNEFDIVTCHHTIEHIINLEAAIAELKRVARRQVMIVTPCQRYYYYTLDMHVNFFPIKSYLQAAIKMENYTAVNIQGDWVYIGNKKTG